VNTITPEADHEDLRRLLADEEPQEPPTLHEESGPPEKKRRLSWADFVALISHYCQQRGWEVEADDFACAIFAKEDQPTDEAEGLQEYLPFWEDLDPYPF
jgi:hypothetical protein